MWAPSQPGHGSPSAGKYRGSALSGTDSAPTGGALVSLLFLVSLQPLLVSSTQQWDQV